MSTENEALFDRTCPVDSEHTVKIGPAVRSGCGDANPVHGGIIYNAMCLDCDKTYDFDLTTGKLRP